MMLVLVLHVFLLLLFTLSCQGLSLQSSHNTVHRRHVLTSWTAAACFTTTANNNANADLPRELDFCLVQIARAVAWAQLLLSQQLSDRNSSSSSEQQQKAAYLEARLGAKALLTGRTGGGANAAVYRLSTLQMTGCLQDLMTAYGADAALIQTWREDIAALIEFDGLDSVSDPSPRSSLTLQQYNDTKRKFVQRQMEERVIPTGRRVLQQFPERRQRVVEYLQQYYADELAVDALTGNSLLLF